MSFALYSTGFAIMTGGRIYAARLTNSLCRGQEKRTMPKVEG
jgi:hypothetical protein